MPLIFCGINSFMLSILTATAFLLSYPEKETRDMALEIERALYRYGFKEIAGYSKGEMPKVIFADCKHPALDDCEYEGSYSRSRRQIIVRTGIGGCKQIVLAFEMARDALAMIGFNDKESERQIATWAVSKRVLEDGGFSCSGRTSWETKYDKRMGEHD